MGRYCHLIVTNVIMYLQCFVSRVSSQTSRAAAGGEELWPCCGCVGSWVYHGRDVGQHVAMTWLCTDCHVQVSHHAEHVRV